MPPCHPPDASSQVNSKTGTPINSIIAMCLASIIIGLTMLGSDVAFIAISSETRGALGWLPKAVGLHAAWLDCSQGGWTALHL